MSSSRSELLVSRIDVNEENEEEQIPPSDLTQNQPETNLAFLAMTGDVLDEAADAEKLVEERSKQFEHLWSEAYAARTPDVIDDALSLISPTRPRPESSPEGGQK